MATASCSSLVNTSSSKINNERIGQAINIELPNMLRELLKIKEPTNLLEAHVLNNAYLSVNLTSHELNKIKNVGSNLYRNFDVTLMYKIIRNLNSIVPSPTKHWGNKNPLVTEITIGDDIERIRKFRNEYTHGEYTNLTDSELANYFSTFKEISERFEAFLGKSNREFVSKIEYVESCCMDIDKAQQNSKQLEELTKRIKYLELIMVGNVPKHRKNNKIEQEELTPENIGYIRDQMKKELEKWMQDDIKFVPTKASKYVLKLLKNKHCVTVVGKPGMGKTAIARHVALQMAEQGYIVIPVTVPSDIRNFYKPGQQSVFVIDDVGGTFTANHQSIDWWEQLLGVVEQILSDNCKIVLSCRSQVYKDRKFNVLVPFKSCECNLNSIELRLSQSEKEKIATAHLDIYDHEIIKMSHCEFFPLLCFLCSKHETTNINEFFRLQFVLYEKQLNSLWDQGEVGRCKICALALCVIYNNKLDGKFLTSEEPVERDLLEDVFKACGINRGTSIVRIKDEMDTLVDTYLKKVNGIYSTIHDTVFDFLVLYCCTKILYCLIKHAVCGFIHERFLWDKSRGENERNQNGFIILTSEDDLTLYLNRLVFEWSKGKVDDVFTENNNMENEHFRDRLITHIRHLDKAEQSKLAYMTTILGDVVVSCLECCCVKGYTNFLPWILDQGIDVNQCTCTMGSTPFMVACFENQLEMMTKLLESGADINRPGFGGITALHYVCLFDKTNGGALDILLNHKCCIDSQASNGVTPLMGAIMVQNTMAVKKLLHSLADINICSYDTQTMKDECLKIVPLVKKNAKDVFGFINEKFPSDIACGVKHCFNKQITGFGKVSPLHFSCCSNSIDITRLLLDRNPDINIQTEDGSTPLLLASAIGSISIVKILLEYGADRDIRALNGMSPLDIANILKYSEIVTLLEDRKRKSRRIAGRQEMKKYLKK